MEILVKFLYLLSAATFIFGIKLMTRVRTSRSGNNLAAAGMILAVVSTFLGKKIANPELILGAVALGSAIGIFFARKTKMTAMPELIAICNGVGGAASALVAALFILRDELDQISGASGILSVVIGTITFAGSGIAFLKLSRILRAQPKIPAAHFFNFLFLIAIIFFAIKTFFLQQNFLPMNPEIIFSLGILAILSAILGIFLVIRIGGADMPVVISLLNSYSGIAGAATGFAIGNIILIITGALIGASGLILTKIMCRAMNRSLANVFFGGFGEIAKNKKNSEYKNIKETSAEEAALIFESAKNVIIIPGYGMAVAQAQHAVFELAEKLEKNGAIVNFAIHPVAGRMPGHMNVLLAEASVPYEKLKDIEQINSQFKNADVAFVIGANDVVNPAAAEDPSSPIFGMPILSAHEAKTTIVVKRSLSPGFAGVKNFLFERENTLMLFGDGKNATEEIIRELKNL